jgi:16S rRNA G966 N2-methylase RsmD
VRASLPDGLAAARLGEEPFDLVFADPPYDFEDWFALLEGIEAKLAPNGELAIEHSARVALPERVGSLERFDSRRYGDTAVSFYRRPGRASG